MQKVNPPISVLLDPKFCAELQDDALALDDTLGKADDSQWTIARKVNDLWSEHKGLFATKSDYLAECSRVANLNTKRKRLSESGETLRRWCETDATYAAFTNCNEFKEVLSFDHFYRAKRLYKNGKVKAPIYALAFAIDKSLPAEDMEAHFDPPTVPSVFDKVMGYIAGLLDKRNMEIIKSKDDRDRAYGLARELDEIVRQYK